MTNTANRKNKKKAPSSNMTFRKRFRKKYNYLRSSFGERPWLEILAGSTSVFFFVYLLAFNENPTQFLDIYIPIILTSALIFVLAGGRDRWWFNFLFVVEVIVVFVAIAILGEKIFKEWALFGKIDLLGDSLVQLWFALILVLVAAFIYKSFFRPEASVVFTWYFYRFYGAFFAAVMILMLVIVLFKSFEFVNALTISKKSNIQAVTAVDVQDTSSSASAVVTTDVVNGANSDNPDYPIQVLGALFALIAVVLGFGTYLIQSRLRRIDKVEEMIDEADKIVSTVVEMILANLPSFTTTQHIPANVKAVLEQVNNMVESSPHLQKSLEKDSVAAARIILAQGVFAFTSLNTDSISYFEKILKLRKDAKQPIWDTYGIALWRLGIALRQLQLFGPSIEQFIELEQHPDKRFRRIGKIGKALSWLAKYRNEVGSRFWVEDNNIFSGKELIKKLNDSADDLAKLNKDYRDHFVMWYLYNILFELGAVNEGIVTLKTLDNKYEATNSQSGFDYMKEAFATVITKTIDPAVAANYSEGAAMLNLIKEKIEGKKRIEVNNKLFIDAIEYAKSIPEDYTLVYSERYLCEIQKEEFITEIEKLESKWASS